jgi:hypothetical protein
MSIETRQIILHNNHYYYEILTIHNTIEMRISTHLSMIEIMIVFVII